MNNNESNNKHILDRQIEEKAKNITLHNSISDLKMSYPDQEKSGADTSTITHDGKYEGQSDIIGNKSGSHGTNIGSSDDGAQFNHESQSITTPKGSSHDGSFSEPDINDNNTPEDRGENKFNFGGKMKTPAPNKDGGDTNPAPDYDKKEDTHAHPNNVPLSDDGVYSNENFELHIGSDLFDVPKELQEDANFLFMEIAKVRDKTLVADERLDHIKSPSNRELLKKAQDLFTRYMVSRDLQVYYIKTLYNNNRSLRPVSEGHLKEMSAAFLNKRSNLRQPVINMLPNRRHSIGRVLYGTSLGLYDFIHFIPTLHSNMRFKMKHNSMVVDSKDNKSGTQGTSVDIYYKHLKTYDTTQDAGQDFDREINFRRWAFNLEDPVNFNQYSSSSSGFTKEQLLHVIKALYKISCDNIKVDFIISGESERRSIIIRRSNGNETYEDGFNIRNNVPDIQTFTAFTPELFNMFVALFVFPSIINRIEDGKQIWDIGALHSVVEYAGTWMHHYILSVIRTTVDDVKVISYTFDFEMTRHTNTECNLDEIYRKLVSEAHFTPITPLHYVRYLDTGKLNMDKWNHFAFFSAMSFPLGNKSINVVKPVINPGDKSLLKLYNQSANDWLSSAYYNSKHSLPFQKSFSFTIDLKQFYREMFVRTFISGDLPNYMLFVSLGMWKGNLSSSVKINPCAMHPVFAKYGLQDPVNHARKISLDLVMDSKGFSTPSYVKYRTRLVKSFPHIYHNYLEVQSSSESILDSIVDISYQDDESGE